MHTITPFYDAVNAIDAGDTIRLKELLHAHPALVRERGSRETGGYFAYPYLVWFIADNPIRIPALPPSIPEITKILITSIEKHAPDLLQEQLTYCLALVATGRVPRECGVQLQLMEMLVAAGAKPGTGMGALAHGNIDAAQWLADKNASPTLAVLAGLNNMDEVMKRAPSSSDNDKEVAVAVAAMYGHIPLLRYLLSLSININIYPGKESGFHSHGTPLHQAVASGNPEAVQLLAEAGADLSLTDKAYQGTPLDWARHLHTEMKDSGDEEKKNNFAAIEAYLHARSRQ